MVSETFLRRAAAGSLDILVPGFVALAVLALFDAVGLAGLVGVALANVAALLTVVGAYVVGFVVLEATTGQTVGKRLLGVEVRMTDGSPCTWTGAILRNLLRPVDLLGGYLVGTAVAVVTDDERRLGDLLAGTVVVAVDGRG